MLLSLCFRFLSKPRRAHLWTLLGQCLRDRSLMAELLVAVPAVLVTTALKVEPLSEVVVAGVV